MNTRTREGQEKHVHSGLLPWPAAEGRVDACHWTVDHDCHLTGFFFQILSLRVTPFVHLSTEVRCCVSHRTECSWLGVVWAMLFNRGILFYSKWPFGQSQHIKEKQSFSFVNSSSLDWVNMKRESSSKVHQRGARMPGQRRVGQLVNNMAQFENTSRWPGDTTSINGYELKYCGQLQSCPAVRVT